MVESNLSDEQKYLEAKDRMEELKKFYTHLITYLAFVPVFIAINYFTYWGYKWFWFPIIGWGISVFIHVIFTFVMGKGWEKKKINQYMEDDKF